MMNVWRRLRGSPGAGGGQGVRGGRVEPQERQSLRRGAELEERLAVQRAGQDGGPGRRMRWAVFAR